MKHVCHAPPKLSNHQRSDKRTLVWLTAFAIKAICTTGLVRSIIATISLKEMPNHELRERFELLKGAEHHKNELIAVSPLYLRQTRLSNGQPADTKQELLRRLDRLDVDYQQVALDHQRETQFNREGQLRERELREELRRLKALMVRSPAESPSPCTVNERLGRINSGVQTRP